MRERNFIAQNKNKWKELESQLQEKKKDPDKLSKLFIQVTDDLSYARTFYPSRFVRVYLNSIAQKLFYTLYRNQRTGLKRFVFFWKEDLPRLIYDARKALLFSFVFFLIAISIGVVSSAYDPEFTTVILGQDYVEMTKENIEKGDPMAVYKKANEMDMFLGITLNNLWVSFLTFITGIIYCIGSIGVLLYNGIMIGVFQYFFYKQQLLMTSMMTIWLHGTLEISGIIIASAGGITMGSGLLFPGTHSRTQSFFLSARRGIKILMGIVPIIIIAGLIESYLTRHTGAPVIIKAILIFLSLFFIFFYFVWYPYRKSKEPVPEQPYENGLVSSEEKTYDFSSIHSNGTIFSEIFSLYKKSARSIIGLSFLFAIIAAITGFILCKESIINTNKLIILAKVFNYNENIGFYFLNTTLFSLYVYSLLKIIAKKVDNNFKAGLKVFGRIVFFSAFINSFFFLSGWLSIALYLLIGPFYIHWMNVSFIEKGSIIKTFNRSVTLVDSSVGKALGFFFILLLSAILLFLLIDSPLLAFYKNILQWNFSFSGITLQVIDIMLGFFMPYISAFLVFPLIIFGNFLEYFTLSEIHEGNGLIKRIRSLRKSI